MNNKLTFSLLKGTKDAIKIFSQSPRPSITFNYISKNYDFMRHEERNELIHHLNQDINSHYALLQYCKFHNSKLGDDLNNLLKYQSNYKPHHESIGQPK